MWRFCLNSLIHHCYSITYSFDRLVTLVYNKYLFIEQTALISGAITRDNSTRAMCLYIFVHDDVMPWKRFSHLVAFCMDTQLHAVILGGKRSFKHA